MNENDLREAMASLMEVYPDGHVHQGAWFYLTRGDVQVAVCAADPQTLGEDIELWNVARRRMVNGDPAEVPDFMADVPSEAVLAVVDAITPMMSPPASTVTIPGVVHARYEPGRILDIVFLPHGSNAGWSGPSAELFDGDADLDVEDTEGPFWRAMQRYLGPLGDGPAIRWEE